MTRPLARLALVALVASGIAACDEEMIALREGSPSDLDVRAYVDADGDGAFDPAADAPLADVTITATSGAGQEVSETTDNAGLASFSAIAPGGYQLSLSGDAPAGAVLASASNPVVSAPFQGASLSAEFRYAYLPGQLSGTVFRDDNMDGQLDPGDTPAPGLPVTLFRGPDTSGEEVASGSTAADGTFQFTTLRPGTYTLEFEPFPTIQIVGGNTLTVDVEPDTPGDVPVQFTGNLVVPISDARAASPGQTVTVEGVVSWQVPWQNEVYFFQDATGGLSTFDFAEPPLSIGDQIRITGERNSFAGEIQLSPVTNLEVLGSGPAPAPTVVTAVEINAGEFQGMLATIDGTVVDIQVFSFDNHLVSLEDAVGDTFSVYVDSRNGMASTDWTVGEVYAVTGVLGTNDADARPHRLEPRFPSDQVLGGSVVTLAQARGMAQGTVVTVEGVVTWQTEWDDRVYFFQDGTGGISTFDFSPPTLQRGEQIRVRGELSAFNGELQLSPVDFADVVGNPGVPAPRAVTGDDINNGLYQGELATIDGTVTAIDVVNTFGTQLVTADDASGTAFSVFIDNRTNALLDPANDVGSSFTFTGVLGTDDGNAPAARLEVRDAQDVQ